MILKLAYTDPDVKGWSCTVESAEDGDILTAFQIFRQACLGLGFHPNTVDELESNIEAKVEIAELQDVNTSLRDEITRLNTAISKLALT